MFETLGRLREGSLMCGCVYLWRGNPLLLLRVVEPKAAYLPQISPDYRGRERGREVWESCLQRRLLLSFSRNDSLLFTYATCYVNTHHTMTGGHSFQDVFLCRTLDLSTFSTVHLCLEGLFDVLCLWEKHDPEQCLNMCVFSSNMCVSSVRESQSLWLLRIVSLVTLSISPLFCLW